MSEAIPQIEGHAAYYTHLKSGHVDKARIIGLENDRFVEKILLGRKYWEAPIITSRICGICPTIHNVTSTLAIEKACGMKSTEQTRELRELMLAGQMIQSHSLHLYLLVLPDYLGVSSSFELQKSHPEIFAKAVSLKQYADQIIETVGGRAVHPIASVPGGFKAYPTKSDLKELLKDAISISEVARETVKLFASFEMPEVKQKVIYSALHDSTYAVLSGEIWTSRGDLFKAEDYTKYVYEELRPYTRAKFGSLKGEVMYVGAMARINLNGLPGKELKGLAQEIGLSLPLENPFDNIMAQALENYYFTLRSIELLEKLSRSLEKEHLKPVVKFGAGTAACEAPRGTLFHHYELDKEGNIIKCDIVTPTVQSLSALELDIKNMESLFSGKTAEERTKLIEMLIRSFDPCITCATH